MMQKWNYEKRDYEPYKVPDSWNVKTYTDMDEIVNCPHCGKELRFGDTYTSHEIHTEHGIGYGVCEDCYFEGEVERVLTSKREVERVLTSKKEVLENG